MLKLLLKLIYVFGGFDYNAIQHNTQDTQKLYHNLGWSIIFWAAIALVSDIKLSHFCATTLVIISMRVILFSTLLFSVKGSNTVSENFFLTQQLQHLLLQLSQYSEVALQSLICKCDANICEYKNLYKKITNQDFITIK